LDLNKERERNPPKRVFLESVQIHRGTSGLDYELGAATGACRPHGDPAETKLPDDVPRYES